MKVKFEALYSQKDRETDKSIRSSWISPVVLIAGVTSATISSQTNYQLRFNPVIIAHLVFHLLAFSSATMKFFAFSTLALGLLFSRVALTAPADPSTVEVISSSTISNGPSATPTIVAVVEPAGGVTELLKDEITKIGSLSWKHGFRFTGNIRASAEIQTTFWSDGMFKFWTKFHTADALCYKYRVVCGVKDTSGIAIFVDHAGKVGGDLCFSADATEIKETVRHSIDIERKWNEIIGGNRNMVCNAGIGIDLLPLMEPIVKVLELTGKVVGFIKLT